MSTRFTIAALIYGMVNAVLFGGGTILVLSVPALATQAMWLLPAIVGASVLLAGPIAWWMAPRLRLRFWQARAAQNPEGQPTGWARRGA